MGRTPLVNRTKITHNSMGESKRKKLLVIIGASVGAFVLFLLLLSATLCCLCRRTRQPSSDTLASSTIAPPVYSNNEAFSTPPPVSNNREPIRTSQPPVHSDYNQFSSTEQTQPYNVSTEPGRAFSYLEIVKITNNFERSIGKGKWGYVYYGCLQNLNSTEVAVKVFQHPSSREAKELITEVKVLTTVDHKNLVPFVGFCEDGTHMGVIYEYMENGNLRDLLMGKTTVSGKLTWKKRLEIAVNVATGLQYLHSGCQEPIIHRDVNSRNILLNDKLDAKVADFGLCKIVTNPNAEATIGVTGTPGYIDPEFWQTGMLTDKSDVYSFGIVLFELICGLTAIFDTDQGQHRLVEWAISMVACKDDTQRIMDPRIQNGHDMESMWKVFCLAKSCTAERSVDRPNMTKVLLQLTEATEK